MTQSPGKAGPCKHGAVQQEGPWTTGGSCALTPTRAQRFGQGLRNLGVRSAAVPCLGGAEHSGLLQQAAMATPALASQMASPPRFSCLPLGLCWGFAFCISLALILWTDFLKLRESKSGVCTDGSRILNVQKCQCAWWV